MVSQGGERTMRLIIEARLADKGQRHRPRFDRVLAVIECPDCSLAEVGLTFAEGGRCRASDILWVSRTLCDGRVWGLISGRFGRTLIVTMRQVLGGIDRILARVGKRFVSSDVQEETITVEACGTVRAAPCPACRARHRLSRYPCVRCRARSIQGWRQG